MPGLNGGYTENNNVQVSCGENVSGTCNAQFDCDTTNGMVVGICHEPDQVIVQ